MGGIHNPEGQLINAAGDDAGNQLVVARASRGTTVKLREVVAVSDPTTYPALDAVNTLGVTGYNTVAMTIVVSGGANDTATITPLVASSAVGQYAAVQEAGQIVVASGQPVRVIVNTPGMDAFWPQITALTAPGTTQVTVWVTPLNW